MMDKLWIEQDYGALQALDKDEKVIIIVGHKAYTDEQESIELSGKEVAKLTSWLLAWADLNFEKDLHGGKQGVSALKQLYDEHEVEMMEDDDWMFNILLKKQDGIKANKIGIAERLLGIQPQRLHPNDPIMANEISKIADVLHELNIKDALIEEIIKEIMDKRPNMSLGPFNKV